jgi:hypothetical protein
MECRIEAGDLAKIWSHASDGSDPGEVVRLVQWRKRNALSEVRLDGRREHDRAIAFRAAMDDPVVGPWFATWLIFEATSSHRSA